MKKKLNFLNTISFTETMYPYFGVTVISIELMIIIYSLLHNKNIIINILTSSMIIFPIFWLIWRLIFNKSTKIYNQQRKIYKHGVNLKIKKVSYDAKNSIEYFNIYNYKYYYAFKITYIDMLGNIKEFISVPYEISSLKNIFGITSTKDDFNQLLNDLQFELKEYNGEKELFIFVSNEVIKKWETIKSNIEFKTTCIPPAKEIDIYENNVVNNYLINSLNNFLESKNIKLKLNQELKITEKEAFEIIIGNLDFNNRDKYFDENIIKMLNRANDIEILAEIIANKTNKDCEIAIYISNYSELNKQYMLTLKIYY